LIRNAIDAIPNKGDIYISTDIQSDGILISVKDTGGGIPKDVMNRLFQPFVTTKEKGTGLGLLYCKNAVEAHGGKISVRTAKGKGTTFDISLPLEYSPDKEIRTVSQIVEERETRRVD
jgi:signal transduction histidine kinase